MEVILDSFFENFSQLERNTLHARYKRRAMVEYLSTVIEGCCRGEECDPQKACRYAIISILRYHEKSLRENGCVCMMGKYHNVLYVAAKLCYNWQLKDTPTICALLDKIYSCEKTFERLWMGALIGINAPYVTTGWKSDFDNQEENLRAMVYFLDHANNACLSYCNENGECVRFIDVPLESCGRATPLKIVMQVGLSDHLHILLRFGARCDVLTLNNLLCNLSDHNRQYPYNLLGCLNFILRTLPKVDLSQYESYLVEARKEDLVGTAEYLVEDGIIPGNRCRRQPAELKHLCRCSIRDALWENHQLPSGIRQLKVPDLLHKYLDLLAD